MLFFFAWCSRFAIFIYIWFSYFTYIKCFSRKFCWSFSYQTCSALFSQKKRLSFDFCIFAKPLVQQMAKMIKKRRRKKIKVLCTFHFVGCGLPVSPFLIYSTGWLLVATGSMIDPRLFCLTVSQSQSYGLSGWGWGWSKAFFFLFFFKNLQTCWGFVLFLPISCYTIIKVISASSESFHCFDPLKNIDSVQYDSPPQFSGHVEILCSRQCHAKLS